MRFGRCWRRHADEPKHDTAARPGPVLIIAGMLLSAISSVFARVTRAELWARRGTGVVFIAVGVYYCLTYIFEIY
jgi:threonine/homoserine/homoserine lactone efflux protein